MSTSNPLVIERGGKPVINSLKYEAIRRTEKDEAADYEHALDNAANEAYLNWPNEAGVSDIQEP